jgi:hypothetical protein
MTSQTIDDQEGTMSSQGAEAVDWRSEWAEAERLAGDSQAEAAMPHYDNAIAMLLLEKGYDVGPSLRGNDFDLAQVAAGRDPEVIFMYMEANAILRMSQDGRTPGNETLALAIEAYRTVHEMVEVEGA